MGRFPRKKKNWLKKKRKGKRTKLSSFKDGKKSQQKSNKMLQMEDVNITYTSQCDLNRPVWHPYLRFHSIPTRAELAEPDVETFGTKESCHTGCPNWKSNNFTWNQDLTITQITQNLPNSESMALLVLLYVNKYISVKYAETNSDDKYW